MKSNNKINFFESPLPKHFNATDKWRTEEAPIHFVNLFENESEQPVEQPPKRIAQDQEHSVLNEPVQLR